MHLTANSFSYAITCLGDPGHPRDGLEAPTPVSTRQALQLLWRLPTAHAGPQKAAHGVAVAGTLPRSAPTALPGLAGPSRPPALSTGLVACALKRDGAHLSSAVAALVADSG